MPNIKSAIKRVQVNETRRLSNVSVKSRVKTAVKKFVEAVPSGDMDNAEGLLKNAIKKMDRAARKGIIHKNAVARKKSKLQKAFNKAKQA